MPLPADGAGGMVDTGVVARGLVATAAAVRVGVPMGTGEDKDALNPLLAAGGGVAITAAGVGFTAVGVTVGGAAAGATAATALAVIGMVEEGGISRSCEEDSDMEDAADNTWLLLESRDKSKEPKKKST